VRNNYDELQKELGDEKVKRAVLEKEKEVKKRVEFLRINY